MKKGQKILVGVFIVIVCLIGLMQEISIWFTEPNYADYCSVPLPDKKSSSAGCISSAEIVLKEESCKGIDGLFVYKYDSNGCVVGGTCNGCRIAYERQVDSYAGSVFIVCLFVGILMLFAGLILFRVKPFGVAFICSGVAVLFYGIIKNWRNFELAWKWIFIFILLILIVTEIFYIKNSGKKVHYVKKSKHH